MTIRRLARRALVATPLPEILVRRRARRFLTVLGYHRVLPLPGPDYPFADGIVSSTPEEFARELKYFRDNLDVISMPELLRGLDDPSTLPPRPAVITFDDGYVDNYTRAFPLLRDAGLTATFFVCTGLVGTRTIPWYEALVCCLKRSEAKVIDSPFGGGDPPYPLDEANWNASYRRFRRHMGRLPSSQVPAALGRLREATDVNPDDHLTDPLFMSWDALGEMAAAGMDIGGHTRTHPILANVEDPQTLRGEIIGCHQDLAARLPAPPVSFAYPWGGLEAMSAEADALIDEAGFRVSFSFMHGLAPRRVGRARRLPRVHVSYGDDYHAFRFEMARVPVLA
jgi:peptidoglycan/xylan/chitin deacetylase (PgdA/CDA1 family)